MLHANKKNMKITKDNVMTQKFRMPKVILSKLSNSLKNWTDVPFYYNLIRISLKRSQMKQKT